MAVKVSACVAILGAALGAASLAAGRAGPASAEIAGKLVPVSERLEMRSHQPYSTLQFGFRPDPLSAPRGLERKRLEIVKPQKLAPVILHGAPTPYSSKWYAYCAERYRSFEPGTGLYTTFSGRRRPCR